MKQNLLSALAAILLVAMLSMFIWPTVGRAACCKDCGFCKRSCGSRYDPACSGQLRCIAFDCSKTQGLYYVCENSGAIDDCSQQPCYIVGPYVDCCGYLSECDGNLCPVM